MNLKKMEDFTNIKFGISKEKSESVKVIGVGGGGSNAVNHMFNTAIKGVGFVVCNTDAQALNESKVPVKVHLGDSLTEGMGAGADPEIGKRAAEENLPRIKRIIDKHTKMVFVTAGMGGGTGTGAAPIIAKLAKGQEILTVGIVTRPFTFEGAARYKQAQEGIENLRNCVDSLIVVDNNKLVEKYGELKITEAFAKVDEVLCTAVNVIARVIINHYKQNIDLNDARTVLKKSGTAIIGSAKASGKNRAKKAVLQALDSPLSDNNKIEGAKRALLLIESSEENEITIDEKAEILTYLQHESVDDLDIIEGVGTNFNLSGDTISVTVIAAGFPLKKQDDILKTKPKKTIFPLEKDQKMSYDLSTNKNMYSARKHKKNDKQFEFPFFSKSNSVNSVNDTSDKKNFKDMQKDNVKKQTENCSLKADFEERSIKNTSGISKTLQNGVSLEKENIDPALEIKLIKLKDQNPSKETNFHQKIQIKTRENQDFNEPTWKRKGIDLKNFRQNNGISRSSLEIGKDDNIDIHTNNSFLHDNVD